MLRHLRSAEDAARWLDQRCTGTLRTDSRQVQPGDAFIAWPGHTQDGRLFVAAALAAGAQACLIEDAGVEPFGFHDARIATLSRLKAETGAIADLFFGTPSASLDLIASTGTNGKTSTAWWTAQALGALNRPCGVIGTLGVGVPPNVATTGLTTPDAVTLHAALRRFVDDGATACALEASSIGLVDHRLTGTRIDIALFTNFTRDHIDFHGTMDAYWSAKRSLFDWPGLKSAVVNIDDPRGAALASELARSTLDLWTVSASAPARLSARHVTYVDGGLAFDVVEGTHVLPLRSLLIGDYNVHNLLCVLGGLRALGVPLVDAVATVPGLTPVPGRMQRVGGPHGPEVVVDYAHTPDALDKALQSLLPFASARGGKLWCVFGCGGNRDATKRPLMGEIAARLAQRVIVTSDNPRDEAPHLIIEQILAGARGAHVAHVVERREAIAHALREAAAADVVLIAGKGHEDYQEIRGVKLPFSDALEAQKSLELRA
jgi:MurE/MurF fusion protein